MSVAEQESRRKKLTAGELLFEPLEQEDEQEPKPIYEKRTERVGNRQSKQEPQADTYEVHEATTELRDDRNRVHPIRRLSLRSASLGRKHANTRERHRQQAQAELEELRGKLNKRTLKTRQAIETAVKTSLSHRKVVGLLDVPIEEHREVVTKPVGRGRPGPNTTYVDEELLSYDVSITRNQEKIHEKAMLDGFFILVTNHDAQEWPASRVLALYKRQ
jgi:hypothetical protein